MINIVYINSTVAARGSMSSDGQISTFHSWGYVPLRDDKLHSHKDNRFDVVLRGHLRGLDITILVHVLKDLMMGYRAIYLVTQPDLLIALPFIRLAFPRVKILTWVWTAEEVVRDLRFYRVCDHIFCLTQGAVDQFKAFDLACKASLQLLGADPEFYNIPLDPLKIYDVCLLGLTGRDYRVVKEAVDIASFIIVTTERAIRHLDAEFQANLVVLDPPTNYDVVCINKQSRVTWIPLTIHEKMPAGYTTLIESLLCGVPVVIADSSIIPSVVLTLPGVFLYRAGCVDSLIDQTFTAIKFGSSEEKRKAIRDAAADTLNGLQLSESIMQLLA